MENFIQKCADDRVLKYLLSVKASENNISQFNVGDEVVVLNSIDNHILKQIKFGSLGYINSISHRYENQPNEHYEFWVVSEGKKDRYEITSILTRGDIEEFL